MLSSDRSDTTDFVVCDSDMYGWKVDSEEFITEIM